MTYDELLAAITFDDAGLVPAIVQDHETHQVLMMAWMNAKSLQQTLTLGETVFGAAAVRNIGTKAPPVVMYRP
ncbi:MAG: hypothetical protein R2932_10715 [Caldilineaceae bacterium]